VIQLRLIVKVQTIWLNCMIESEELGSQKRATINFKLEQVTDAPCLDLLITGVESSPCSVSDLLKI